MEAAQEQPRASLLHRVMRWIGDFETAMDGEGIDDLHRRVARLERRLAADGGLRDGASARGRFPDAGER
jgi:hypothetical protein